MILLHAILLVNVLLPALSAPDLSQALARVNEAKARALANRAKIRAANSARISNHVKASRLKRQQTPEYAGPYAQPPPPPPPSPPHQETYEEEEPTLVHLCSLEDDDDDYARSAEHEDHDHVHFVGAAAEHFDDSLTMDEDKNEVREAHDEAMRNHFVNQDKQRESSLDKALEELSEVRDILNDFEEENLRRSEPESSQRPNSKFAAHFLPQNKFENHPAEFSSQQSLSQEKPRSSSHELLEKIQEMRDADAHHHAHTHIHSHGTVPFVPSTVVNPGLLTPGLNLNINQNQGLNTLHGSQGLHSLTPHSAFINQGVHTPLINQGVFSTQSTSTSTSITQNRPFLRHSDVHSLEKSAEGAQGFHSGSSGLNQGSFGFQSISPGLTQGSRGFQTVSPGLNQGSRGFQSVSPGLNQGSRGFQSVSPGLNQGSRGFQSVSPGLNQGSRGFQSTGLNQFNGGQSFSNRPNNLGFNSNSPQGSLNNNRFISPNLNRPTSGFQRLLAENPESNLREDDAGIFSEEDEDVPPQARTIKKLKLLKKLKNLPTYYIVQPPAYNNPYPQYYREAEDVSQSEEDSDIEDPHSLDRDASPTHGKKRKQKSGHFREAEDEESDLLAVSSEMRDASPTFKKLKQKKTQYIPIYVQPQHYGSYREAEEDTNVPVDDLTDTSSESREASPTHKKFKHKKTKFIPVYVQPQHYGSYREAENGDDFLGESESADNFESRDANSHNEKGKHKTVDENEENDPFQQRNNSLDELISSSFIFNFPQERRMSEQYKRSLDKNIDQLLEAQRKIVDSLNTTTEDNEDLKFVTDIGNRTLATLEEQRKKVSKRSIPLTRLMIDPHVKLDVPKTLENVGTVTKKSFEDERAPMYHFKHLLGSSKNAFLSAMRIPPQNMIIPSDYEIIRASERDADSSYGSNAIEDDDPFSNTFRRVGQMVRDSVRSGQETAIHLGDVAHSARNMLNTARHSAPRLIIPYSQIPAVQDTRLKKPSKAILITPRIVDLAEETLGKKASDSRPNFVRLGHLMDAVGISKPETKNLDLHKIIFEPRGIKEAKVDKRLEQLYGRFRDKHDDVAAVKEALEDAKLSVGAKNLKDFLVQMRGELTDLVHPPKQHKKKKSYILKKKQETKEMGKFIETLFDKSTEQSKNEEPKQRSDQNELVGEGLFLPPELMRPFMGRPTDTELHTFLRDNGDEEEVTPPNTLGQIKKNTKPHHHENLKNHDLHNNSDLGYVLGAVNPLMFERMYNQTVKIHNNDATNPEDLFRRAEPEKNEDFNGNGTVGTSMTVNEPLLTPFMGQARPEQVADLLDSYNNDDDSDYGQMD